MQKIDLRNASREELMKMYENEKAKHMMQQMFEEDMMTNTVGRLSLIIGVLITVVLFLTGGLIWEPGNGIVAGIATAFLISYMLTKISLWFVERARAKHYLQIRKKEKPAKKPTNQLSTCKS